MNETIREMVARLFRDCEETEEVRAAREEITGNCQEHFRDLVSGGMSKAQALQVIADSLSGMEELVKSYPRRQAEEEDGAAESGEAAEPEASAKAAPEPEAAPEQSARSGAGAPADTVRDFDAGDVKSLELSMVNRDLTVVPSTDGVYRILCDTEETARALSASCGDGVLKLSFTEPLKRDLAGDFRDFTSDVGENLKGLEDVPAFLGKLGSLVTGSIKRAISTMDHGKITLEIPGTGPDCRIGTTAGNVTAERVIFGSLNVQTVSGDIRVSLTGARKDARLVSTSGDLEAEITAGGALEVSTISGDIRLDTQARKVSVRSTSGDVQVCPVCAECQVNTVSGDARVELSDPRVRQLKVATVSGDARVTLPAGMALDLRMTSRSGEAVSSYRSGGTSRLEADISSVSGDVNID